MSADNAVILEHVTKRYQSGQQTVTAVADVSLRIRAGDFVSIMGPSGCGKSTLLNLIAGLDVPDHGRVLIGAHDLGQLSDDARSDLRLAQVGFVFQSFHLLPTFTIEENVAWPLELQGLRSRQVRERAHAALARTGIEPPAFDRLPAELSGGEQQRVAIARAIATRPPLLLADEPTGNLDSHTGVAILDLLRSLNRTQGVTIVMATHSTFAGAYGHRTIDFCDGRVAREYTSPTDPHLRAVQREW